jgi:hypothetical protein
MNKLSKDFHCNICDKYYKSYQSLWNHNKRFHSDITLISTVCKPNINHVSPAYQPNINHISTEKQKYKLIESKKGCYLCKFCNKEYKTNQGRWKHQKKCEKSLKEENEELKHKYKMMEEKYGEQIKILSKKVEELINTNCKVHYKTLQKINKQQHIENQQNNTQNINTQNNINIIGFTKENLLELFSPKEKLNILQKKFNSLSYIIEYTHFNKKYPQMNNIKITNLNNNIAHIYDGVKNKFIATTKDKLISDLIINRMYDIEEFKGEVMEKMTKKEKDIINRMLNKFYEDEEIFIDNKKEEIIHFNEYIFSI